MSVASPDVIHPSTALRFPPISRSADADRLPAIVAIVALVVSLSAAVFAQLAKDHGEGETEQKRR